MVYVNGALDVFTSTQDDCGDEEHQVALLQLECSKFIQEVKLGLHHVAERFAEALDELSGHEDSSLGHQHAVLVGEVTQADDVHLEGAVLQHGDLIAQLQLLETRDALRKLCDSAHALGRAVLHTAEHGQLQLGDGEQSRHRRVLPHQEPLTSHQRLHIVDDEQLTGGRMSDQFSY